MSRARWVCAVLLTLANPTIAATAVLTQATGHTALAMFVAVLASTLGVLAILTVYAWTILADVIPQRAAGRTRTDA